MRPCLIDYLDRISAFEDRDYLLNLIRFTISPTLDNVKASTLMIFKDNSKVNLKEYWTKHETYIKNKLDIKFYTLKETSDSVHVIFYKPQLLFRVLNSEECRTFLQRFGYNRLSDLDACLRHLRDRYDCFCPHEIGIFLGYPIYDVLDFINPSNKKECLMKGYWKVYNDLDRARRIFQLYDESKSRVYNSIIKQPF